MKGIGWSITADWPRSRRSMIHNWCLRTRRRWETDILLGWLGIGVETMSRVVLLNFHTNETSNSPIPKFNSVLCCINANTQEFRKIP
jgi:hypothetical protein